ncbi:MAG: succinylglutamate desuccinylase, partial [Kiloniellales bacterium]
RLWSPARLDAADDPADGGAKDHVELRRARELLPLIESIDLLLDLHSLQQPSPPLILSGPHPKGVALARRVGFPGIIVSDAGHAAGTRLRDYGAFADPASPRNALLVECGQHWARGTEQVAIETALRFLATTGTIDTNLAARFAAAGPTTPQRVIEVTEAVTVQSADFSFATPYRGLEVIARAGTEIARDGDRPIRTPYDDCVLVMPSLRLSPGQTAVRLGRYLA